MPLPVGGGGGGMKRGDEKGGWRIIFDIVVFGVEIAWLI